MYFNCHIVIDIFVGYSMGFGCLVQQYLTIKYGWLTDLLSWTLIISLCLEISFLTALKIKTFVSSIKHGLVGSMLASDSLWSYTLWSSRLHLLSAGIAGLCYHAWLMMLDIKPKASNILGKHWANWPASLSFYFCELNLNFSYLGMLGLLLWLWLGYNVMCTHVVSAWVCVSVCLCVSITQRQILKGNSCLSWLHYPWGFWG